ncbi:lysostaphin resistance A-like protein [Rossellomorea sp. NPDC077527]|uniref:lysostaphin resistance A-like protein n=1 Tax=Rossellomorea sp. NPDC077527 TaxID=3364510 RepID=UPI0037CB4265
MKKFLLVYGKMLITTLTILVLTSIVVNIPSENNLVTKVMFFLEKLLILVPVIVLYRLFEKNNWGLGMKQMNPLSNFSKGALLGLISITISLTISILSVKHMIVLHHINDQLILSLIYFLVVSFLVSLSEEVLFRGYIQGLASFYYNYKVGIVFSTIFFVAMHGLNNGITLFAFLELVLGGIFLGILRAKTNGLWFGIGFHFLWDFIQVGIFGLSLSEQKGISLLSVTFLEDNILLTGGVWGPEASVITTFVLALLLLSIIIRGFISEKNDKLNKLKAAQ